MSVRREVISLSQLLRRSENSNSRRGAPRAPPLPLQTSRHRTGTPLSADHKSAGGRQTKSIPLTERPTSSGYPPQSFPQSVLDANRASTSQPDIRANSQTSNAYSALSQEDSEELSAMTTISQSSFSQTQSQNLLESSQDDQVRRVQQWQAQQAPLPAPLSTVRCSGSEKLQELEQNLTKVIVEQTRDHMQQHQEMIARLASPIKKSIEEVKTKLAASSEDKQQQNAAIGEIAGRIDGVVTSVSELHRQSLSSKAASEETHKAMISEAVAVRAALTELHARVESVEGSVKLCSDQVAQFVGGDGTKHEALLSAVAASSCKCPQESAPAEDPSSAERTARKRKRSPSRPYVTSSRYASPSSAEGSPVRASSRHPLSLRYEAVTRDWHAGEENGASSSNGLRHSLQRIESLRAKRRNYLLGL